MRTFKLRVGERLRSTTRTERHGSNQKTKRFDEKTRDYVVRKPSAGKKGK